LCLVWAFDCQAVSERRSLFLAFFIGFGFLGLRGFVWVLF
jgi:hypothetical protein